MNTERAKKGSGLKKLFGWIVATIAAVPVTKMVENYFDVSFFSSSITAFEAWLCETIPVQLWLFCLVVAVSAAAVAFGAWSFLEKRFAVGDSTAERDKAYAKARDVIEKYKASNKELEATQLELKATRKKLEATDTDLTAAYAKITDLQAPEEQPLNEHQRLVLAGIAFYDNSDEKCYVKDLCRRINFTMVQTEGAVDVLVKRKLVDEYYTGYGSRVVSLSPDGRASVLHPEFDMSYLPL